MNNPFPKLTFSSRSRSDSQDQGIVKVIISSGAIIF